MLEILLVIWIIRTYKKAAIQYKQKTWLWQLIGACAYLVPTYISAFFIAPMLVNTFAPDNLGWSFLSVVISVGIGAGVAMLVLQGLKKSAPQDTWQEEILDQE
ncbi:MAG: hypothetical protein NWR73_07460 [Flavobacteriales bacterium]|jgi:hypothetical protein|nr:hypothetical protein [Flavobacteriales bacterium]